MVPTNADSDPQITKLSNKQDEKFLDTGIADLNDLIGGGLPLGRIVEMWGQQSVGKTHVVAEIMANVSQKHKILFVDAEFSLNKERLKKLGVKLENVDYIADSRLERVCELLVNSIGKYQLIILDSLAYLTPLTIDTNEIGETSIGLFARLIKHWIVKFRPRLGVSKTAFIAINQYRAPIGMYVKPESPGGKSWQHAVDVRIFLTSNAIDKIVKDGVRTAQYTHLETTKNKLSAPYKSIKLRINY